MSTLNFVKVNIAASRIAVFREIFSGSRPCVYSTYSCSAELSSRQTKCADQADTRRKHIRARVARASIPTRPSREHRVLFTWSFYEARRGSTVRYSKYIKRYTWLSCTDTRGSIVTRTHVKRLTHLISKPRDFIKTMYKAESVKTDLIYNS